MRRRPAPTPSLRISRLRRRAEVQALAKAARALGVDAWIVGGAIRDAALGIADAEIDAAVSGDVERVAKALEENGAGRAVFLSRDRPGPRVYRIAARRPFDLAEIEGGSIEADLGRRDFTVNAVAMSIADGTILDPHGGLADLARRRLHPVRASNLADDPLRALRAARLHATRGLVPDRETVAAARTAAPKLSSAASERIGAELARLLGSPRAAPAIGWAVRAGILAATLGRPLDRRLAGKVSATLRKLDGPATAGLPESTRRRLRLAGIALALGLNDAEARRWLGGRRLPRREVDDAVALVTLVHGIPRRAGREDWRWIVDAGPFAADALHLVARSGRVRERNAATRLRRLVRKPRRRLPITGGDVMAWLSIPPGPRVGELLSEVAVEVARGAVKSRREARNWLTGQVRSASERL